MAGQVLGRQGGHHVDVPDASVRVLDVQVERLLVEDRSGGVLVLVSPAPDLDHAFHERDDELGVLLGHDVRARDDGRNVAHLQGPVRILGQVLDRLELARCLLEMLQGAALGVDRIDDTLLAAPPPADGRQGRACGPAWSHSSEGLSMGSSIFGIIIPVIRVGELHDLDVVAGHVVQH